MVSASDSGSEDDAAGLQAQVAQMLGPLGRKVRKAQKKIENLEMLFEQLRKMGDEGLPTLQKEMITSAANTSARLERVQSEVAQLASKTSLEVVREEQSTSELRLRQQVDELKAQNAAQDIVVRNLESRLASMETAQRASELKMSNELSATVAQLAQLNASVERTRGETDANLREQSSRMATQHDALLTRLGQAEEDGRQVKATLATKTELAELSASVQRRAEESESGLKDVKTKFHGVQETLEALHSRLATEYATFQALDEVRAKAESLGTEMRSLAEKSRAQGDSARHAWEDKLLTRQHKLETNVQEGRRDWHRLAAQCEELATHVSARALRTEHEALESKVAILQEEKASNEDLSLVETVARAAASGTAFAVLEAEVRSLAANTKADAAAYEERFGRTADGNAFKSLEDRVGSLAIAVDGKISASEARFAMDNKLDKTLGETTAAQVETIQQRISQLNERANNAETSVSKAESSQQRSISQTEELHKTIEELREQMASTNQDVQSRGSEVHDIIKAVRALAADAELRAALDEREIEFLWAAPAHIYGQHGWRPNNGSKSERTPYPAGNFKMAVRHGTEGNARDVLAARKKWLNSITVGGRESSLLEIEAMSAGKPDDKAVAIRLPDIDESRRLRRSSRPESPHGILGPAHDLLQQHESLGGGVGLGRGPGASGRATRVAHVSDSGAEPWSIGMGSAPATV